MYLKLLFVGDISASEYTNLIVVRENLSFCVYVRTRVVCYLVNLFTLGKVYKFDDELSHTRMLPRLLFWGCASGSRLCLVGLSMVVSKLVRLSVPQRTELLHFHCSQKWTRDSMEFSIMQYYPTKTSKGVTKLTKDLRSIIAQFVLFTFR